MSEHNLDIIGADIHKYAKENEKILLNCVKKGQTFYKNFNVMTKTFYGLLYYILGNIDEQGAREFLEMLTIGSGIPKEHFILGLRSKLIDAKVHRRPFPTKVRLGMIFKAWNLYRQGRITGNIGFKIDNELPELI